MSSKHNFLHISLKNHSYSHQQLHTLDYYKDKIKEQRDMLQHQEEVLKQQRNELKRLLSTSDTTNQPPTKKQKRT